MLLPFIHIINILSLFLSSTGILMHQHYCQDQLKSVSFYAKLTHQCCQKKHSKTTASSSCCQKATKKCCSRKAVKSCCSSKKHSQSPSFSKKDCCEDKTAFDKTSIQWQPISIDLPTAVFTKITTPLVIRNTWGDLSNNLSTWPLRIPYNALGFFPPPDNPLHIVFQSFLC